MTTLPDWMLLPWHDAMKGSEWLALWRMAEQQGNTTLAVSLLHVAFDHPVTCTPEVTDKVIMLADGRSVYFHKLGCDRCNCYLMRGAAGSGPCARTRIAEKARHTLILGLLRSREHSTTPVYPVLSGMRDTDPLIGLKLLTFLWGNHSWLQLNKQEMQIATEFLEHLSPSWLQVRDDLDRRKLYFRVLCLWGLTRQIEPVTMHPDPVNVRLLEEIALEGNDGPTVLAVYQNPSATIYCRIAAERALALGMLVPHP